MNGAPGPDPDFVAAYAQHRAAQGRGYSGEALAALPYLRTGPHARQWRVRARSFDAFMAHVVRPLAAVLGRPLRVGDLGAGNGWLSYRLALDGHDSVAIDVRDDVVDGLGVAGALADAAHGRMECLVAPFEAVPLVAASLDLAVFNASLHYAVDLAAALAEACRITAPGGALAIIDSPFYRQVADGEAMVEEKHASGGRTFGALAGTLLARPVIEYLTPARLAEASAQHGLDWRRIRVRYPLWYELRPLNAWLTRARRPSRFDVWVADRR